MENDLELKMVLGIDLVQKCNRESIAASTDPQIPTSNRAGLCCFLNTKQFGRFAITRGCCSLESSEEPCKHGCLSASPTAVVWSRPWAAASTGGPACRSPEQGKRGEANFWAPSFLYHNQKSSTIRPQNQKFYSTPASQTSH